MVSWWVIIGLVISAVAVSGLGAFFSVSGIGALFSGAVIAVSAMAASLELAKFVLAAYLHQRWARVNRVMRTYFVIAVLVLSGITSLGIFGFLTEAYQVASQNVDSQTIKIASLTTRKERLETEIARLNKALDEIPVSRVTRRLELRREIEPAINEINLELAAIDEEMTAANLKMLEVKRKVGPLLNIAQMFNMGIDQVVKYLILLFVLVFDPLAICLVVAVSEALLSRKRPQPLPVGVAAPQHQVEFPSPTVAPAAKQIPLSNPEIVNKPNPAPGQPVTATTEVKQPLRHNPEVAPTTPQGTAVPQSSESSSSINQSEPWPPENGELVIEVGEPILVKEDNPETSIGPRKVS